MATHPHDFGSASALPLSVLLAAIPSLPRPILSRLTSRMIERLDEIDGDADLEDDDHGGGNVDNEGEQDNADYEPDTSTAWGMPGWAGGVL